MNLLKLKRLGKINNKNKDLTLLISTEIQEIYWKFGVKVEYSEIILQIFPCYNYLL